MVKAVIASLALSFSVSAFAFEEWETACMDNTEKEVSDLQKAGVIITLREQLQIYQTCVTENTPEEESYEERCGDRRGGAYDNCTN